MHSTDTNLSNPDSIDNIQLHRPNPRNISNSIYDVVRKQKKTVRVTQLFYDQMKFHDPDIVYEIIDSPSKVYYENGKRITNVNMEPLSMQEGNYYIGYGDHPELGEFGVFQYINSTMIQISNHPNIEYAIHAINTLSSRKAVNNGETDVYESLCNFVDGNVGIHDTIVNLTLLNVSATNPEIRFFVNTITMMSNGKRNIPVIKVKRPGSKYYTRIYNTFNSIIAVFEEYDYFEDRKYMLDHTLLLNEGIVDKIVRIVYFLD